MQKGLHDLIGRGPILVDHIDLDQFQPWLWIGGAGMLGRIMYHAKQVQSGKRKPLSWALFWDVPIGIGMGWVALGIGKYCGVQWETTVSIGLATSYLGPYMIDIVFAKALDWKFGGKASD